MILTHESETPAQIAIPTPKGTIHAMHIKRDTKINGAMMDKKITNQQGSKRQTGTS
jgi:hypothetical protein